MSHIKLIKPAIFFVRVKGFMKNRVNDSGIHGVRKKSPWKKAHPHEGSRLGIGLGLGFEGGVFLEPYSQILSKYGKPKLFMSEDFGQILWKLSV